MPINVTLGSTVTLVGLLVIDGQEAAPGQARITYTTVAGSTAVDTIALVAGADGTAVGKWDSSVASKGYAQVSFVSKIGTSISPPDPLLRLNEGP